MRLRYHLHLSFQENRGLLTDSDLFDKDRQWEKRCAQAVTPSESESGQSKEKRGQEIGENEEGAPLIVNLIVLASESKSRLPSMSKEKPSSQHWTVLLSDCLRHFIVPERQASICCCAAHMTHICCLSVVVSPITIALSQRDYHYDARRHTFTGDIVLYNCTTSTRSNFVRPIALPTSRPCLLERKKCAWLGDE